MDTLSQKSIVTFVLGSKNVRTTIDFANRLTRRAQGHNKIVFMEENHNLSVAGLGDIVAQTIVEENIERKDKDKYIQRTIDSLLTSLEGLNVVKEFEKGDTMPSVRLVSDTRIPNIAIKYHGTLAHNLVVSRPQEDDGDVISNLIETALFEAKNAVLIPPSHIEDCEKYSDFKTVGMLWRGDSESARVLLSVVRMLDEDTKFFLFGKKDEMPLDVIQEFLYLNDVNFEVIECDIYDSDKEKTEVINDLCNEFGLHLLAMGAFTKGRISNWLFGGLTYDILYSIDIPILLRA